MGITDIIARKRDGRELSAAEIEGVVSAYLREEMSDAQMAALLMAVFLQGMTREECAALTRAMAASGERLDLSSIPGIKVDKHSTGGVGDKTTLVVAPLVAALGVPVPKMSGRALGHTGGTIDKLEAIPGLITALSPERFCRQVSEIGVAIAAQSAALAPADKRIYALRDHTATVGSLPLIVSSVMSKKLAVGADAIVLDVKMGGGAFAEALAEARELATAMVAIGAEAGKRMVATITRMDQPLGRAVGDAAEVAEAAAALAGRAPADLEEVCLALAGHMLALGGVASRPEQGRERAREALHSGIGLEKLRQLVAAQGGSVGWLARPEELLAGSERVPVELPARGVVTALGAPAVGAAVRDLKAAVGTGKHLCGVLLERKVGDQVGPEPVAWVLAPAGATAAARQAAERVAGAYQLGEAAPPAAGMVVDTVTG